ncbi:hypothetical protein BMJ22_05685 [Sinorhizobium medicae]|nr:hypothetical protein BMJ22_05685 [Sinorhizobium medicae]
MLLAVDPTIEVQLVSNLADELQGAADLKVLLAEGLLLDRGRRLIGNDGLDVEFVVPRSTNNEVRCRLGVVDAASQIRHGSVEIQLPHRRIKRRLKFLDEFLALALSIQQAGRPVLDNGQDLRIVWIETNKAKGIVEFRFRQTRFE